AFFLTTMAALAGAGATPATPDDTLLLLGARTRAYDATARNDARGLQSALTAFEGLAGRGQPGAWASYYAAFTAWNLAASHLQAGDKAAALEDADTAVRHARRAVALDAGSAECQNMLANAMIGHAVIAGQYDAHAEEIAAVRRKALALGPRNPRVGLMEDGVIFNVPPERGGDKQKGIARWLEAM